ncbi:MAG: hypothetical protein I8H67_09030 [Comamonadaceae bacterium]|nr:hypothetical protein [Comamonadaceae bacterium]
MSAALHRRLLELETAGQADNVPRLVLVCRAGRENDAITGIKAQHNVPGLRRLPGESLEDLEARAIASIKGPGLAIVLADYD